METEGVDPGPLDPVLLDFRDGRAAMKAKYFGDLFPASAVAEPGVLFRCFFQNESRRGTERGRASGSRELAMITNERQYRITRNKVKSFERALAEFDANAAQRAEVHPRLVQAEREAMEAQLASLREELEEYERLKSVGVSAIAVTSIDELAEGLIKARIARGLSQRELAQRLELKAQQIQRYEAERYASASYQRLCEVAHALGVGSKTRFSVQ